MPQFLLSDYGAITHTRKQDGKPNHKDCHRHFDFAKVYSTKTRQVALR